MTNSLMILLLFIASAASAQDLPCKLKYPNQRCKERYLEDNEGHKHGKYIAYYEDGTAKEVSYYDHGRLNGTSTLFYNWGKFVTNYTNGKENGLYQKIASDGKVLEKGNYTNGIKTGPWLEYGNDQGSYMNGQRHGKWVIYRKGWGSEGGITSGTYDIGNHVGTWQNLIIIGKKKPNGFSLDTEREIVIPSSSTVYEGLEEYYSEGYKAEFDQNGYYIAGYDAQGTPLKAKVTVQEIVTRTDNKQALSRQSIDFYKDSYYIRPNGRTVGKIIPDIEKLYEDKPVRLIIVGHAVTEDVVQSEDEISALYVLSLNRAFALKEQVKQLVGTHVTIEHIAVGDIKTPGFNADNGMIEIFIENVDPEIRKTYEQMQLQFKISASDTVINNVGLLNVTIKNIYMNRYGKDRDEILYNMPIDFIKDKKNKSRINYHIEQAIQQFPASFEKLQNKQITKEVYQKQIEEIVSAINQNNF